MQKNIVIGFPLQGEWISLRPPGHHPHAIDFVGLGKNRRKWFSGTYLRFIFSSIPVTDFYGWAKPIYAPLDGTVVQASDGWADNGKVDIINTIAIWFKATFLFRPKADGSNIDIRPNAGNYVMIKSGPGIVAFMAHMRSGSVKVAAGQRVVAGQIIGEVGNSGNTTAPHLHINVFDQVNDLLQAKVLPFVFRRYERWNGSLWEAALNGAPEKGEIVRVQTLNV